MGENGFMKWVQNASTPFWNCEGSYFSMILESLVGANSYQDFLILLAPYHIVSKSLELPDDIMNKNSWTYQPITIINQVGCEFAINNEFFEQIEYYFHIRCEIEYPKDIVRELDKLDVEKCCFIINVDEFFFKDNKTYYSKKHNKHSLLIQKINKMQKTVLLYDSESAKSYEATYDDVAKMFHHSIYRHRACKKIHYSDYTDALNIRKDFQTYLCTILRSEWMTEFFHTMIGDLSLDKVNFYALQGYRYTILFKILPYIKMRTILSRTLCHPNKIEIIEQIEGMWECFHNIIYIQLLRRQLILEEIDQSIKQIIKGESNLRNYN